jgi:hypothetical protein
MMVVRLLILIVIGCYFSNIEAWPSEQPYENNRKKRKAEMLDLLPEAKRRRVEDNTKKTHTLPPDFAPFHDFEEFEFFRHLVGQEDRETQTKILNYFEAGEEFACSPAEKMILTSLPLETWTQHLSVYDPTFSRLCILKANLNHSWTLPDQIKDHIFAQAKQNVTTAVFQQGMMYDFGVGVEQDSQKAFNNYLLAANTGYPPAQWEVGLMYETGKGTDESKEKAFDHFLAAANNGHTPAQWKVGLMYMNGQSTTRDEEKAFQYSFQAAEKGYPKAQFNVGIMYREGRGPPKDEKKAFEYLLRAAEQDDVEAQYNVGVMYAKAEGVTKDIDQAIKWHLAVNRNENLTFKRTFSLFKKSTLPRLAPWSGYHGFLKQCYDKIREFYGVHMMEENINNPGQITVEKMKEGHLAIPTLYPHYKTIAAYEKKVIEILDAFTLPGFMINSWQVNPLLLPGNPFLESLQYYRRYSLKSEPYGYISLGDKAVKQMSKLIELISDTSPLKQSFKKSAQFLKTIYEKLCVDISAEVIQRQTELRLGKDIAEEQDLRKDFSDLNVRLEHYQNHLNGLEYAERLPNDLQHLISKGVSNRNKIFEGNHPSIFEE